jgi:hypothetical protein
MRIFGITTIFLILSTPTFAQVYSVDCESGRWEGNNLSTKDNSSKIEKNSNGISLPNLNFKFSLPAKLGASASITTNDKTSDAVIMYFYDHTKWLADESYVIILSQPKQILERWVIQIDSGWTHYTYTKAYGGFGDDELSTQSFAKKCNLNQL